MVMQLREKRMPAIPQELVKEIKILRDLGLQEYEIEYLIFLRTKQFASQKWER